MYFKQKQSISSVTEQIHSKTWENKHKFFLQHSFSTYKSKNALYWYYLFNHFVSVFLLLYFIFFFDFFTGVVKSHIGGADMAKLSIGTLLDSPANECCYSTLSGQNMSVSVILIADGFSKLIHEVCKQSSAFYNCALFKKCFSLLKIYQELSTYYVWP